MVWKWCPEILFLNLNLTVLPINYKFIYERYLRLLLLRCVLLTMLVTIKMSVQEFKYTNRKIVCVTPFYLWQDLPILSIHKNPAYRRHWISQPMQIGAPIFVLAVFYQEIVDYGQVLMAVRNTFFHQEIAGYAPLQSSHQGDHQEIAGYGEGNWPL